MRIAVYQNLPLGGARRVSFELGRYLAAHHEVDFYRLSVFDDGRLDLSTFARRTIVTTYAPLRGLLKSRVGAGHFAPRSYTLFWPLKRLHRALAGRIDTGGYDAVLAHSDAMTQAPYLLRWLERTPSLYYCHEPLRVAVESASLERHRRALNPNGSLLGRLRELEDRGVIGRLAREDRLNARAATAVAVNSRHTRELVRAAYDRGAEICHPGVDITLFHPSDGARRFEFLSIGSPVEAKGHARVIEALATLPEKARPALRVVLPRPETARLRDLAERSRVSLELEVGIADEQLAERYRSALALVCAAADEPFGLTPLEAMASGTPVIAISAGGYVETVQEGETGLLVDAAPEALADALAKVAGNSELRERMGTAARSAVERDWTWERSGRRLEDILGGLVKARTP